MELKDPHYLEGGEVSLTRLPSSNLRCIPGTESPRVVVRQEGVGQLKHSVTRDLAAYITVPQPIVCPFPG